MDRVLAEMPSPFTALLFSAEGSTPLAWSSDRHGIARVLTAQLPRSQLCHLAMEAIMCVLLVLPPGC